MTSAPASTSTPTIAPGDWRRFAEVGRCPVCRGAVQAATETLRCAGCGAGWPVVEGIARFVDSSMYVDSFSFQWTTHPDAQHDKGALRDAEQVFRDQTGLGPEDVRGKRVLDVGVGTGRFAALLGRWGADVVGIDLSQSVVSAHRNLRAHGTGLVAQADLCRAPFAPETFDLVYSIGVLHHTPSTRAALAAIAPLVKLGGRVCIGVYEADPFGDFSKRYRRWTTTMSHRALHALCRAAAPTYHVLSRLRRVWDDGGARYEQALYFHQHEDPEVRVLNTFDWYSPKYQWLHHEDEVKGWFRELGFDDVRREPDRKMMGVNGVRARRVEPPAWARELPPDEPAPLPFLPPGLVRDATLGTIVTAEVVRAVALTTGGVLRSYVTEPAVAAARAAIARRVVRVKRALGLAGP